MSKNTAGFTLIEALVTIMIIASVAGMFMANYRAGERNSALNLAANKLASDIRLAQNYAMSQKEYGGVSSREGWGAYLDTSDNTRYIIYSERSSPPAVNHEYNGEVLDGLFMTVDLPYGIVINSIDLDGSAMIKLSVGYEPPDPNTYFNNDPASDKTATITVLDTRTGVTREVAVNLVGLIDVNQ